jgi:hypothetical protein
MSTTSIQNTDDPTASKKCQGDGRSGSGAQLLETAALWLACQGNGSGTPVMAGLGLQRLGPSLCAGCGCRAGSRVAASLCVRTQTWPWVRTFIPPHPGPQGMLSDNDPRTSSPCTRKLPGAPRVTAPRDTPTLPPYRALP